LIRTQIQLYPEQLNWLKKQGIEEGRSMSQIIRDSVDHYRTHVEKTKTFRMKKSNALKAVGTFATAPEAFQDAGLRKKE
jgi:hypothetical protein